ncbi:MAG: ATP adenylyltransferase, partial [Cystobacter sp.]
MNTRTASPSPLRPEDLWSRTLDTTRHGLATGALQPIATECRPLEHRGVSFQVRLLGRAHLKEDRAKREPPRAAPFNPFEHPDPDLVVGGLTPTHVCLLNKFNVVEHHLLIVTRRFEEQESFLTLEDFEALALCMSGLDGLAFYNSGEAAGASQRHKHLQLIPPLGPGPLRVPMEAWLAAPLARGVVTRVPELDFGHAATGLGPWEADPARDGARLLTAYQLLMGAAGMG